MGFRKTILSVALVSLSACSFMPEEPVDIGPTLTNLQPARMPDVQYPMPSVHLEQVANSYRSALEVTDDPATRRQISVRLADLEMTRAEELLLAGATSGPFFTEAIALYKALINDTESTDNAVQSRDQLLYQLAKAYALDGETESSEAVLASLVAEHPESDFVAEAQFRAAERAFSESDYRRAAKNYYAVAKADQESSFYLNSVYMLGWAQFKQQRYSQALDSFTKVLDKLAGENGQLDNLGKSDKTMAGDTFRVMGLTFSYLDGANTITETYQRLGTRLWQYQLYRQLGELYLEKKRFRDSADTYIHFVEQFPFSDHAPAFSVSTIEVYDVGGFPSLLLPAKQDFVSRYGLYSEYWAAKGQEIRSNLEPHLHGFLVELSSYEHASAQALREAAKKKLALNKVADKKLAAQQSQESHERFLKAAALYREFVDTFPQDEKTPEMAFLLAESLFEGGQLVEAYNAYEKVAYDYPYTHQGVDPKRSAEAGYSAILVAQELIPQFNDAPLVKRWQQNLTQSSLRFAEHYKNDKRAPVVLTQAAQALLADGQLPAAISAATRLTEWEPKPAKALRESAWLVLAQAQFDSGVYPAAEMAYTEVLSLLSKSDKRHASIIERRAASVFQYAEQLLAQGKKTEAVEQLLRVRGLAPDSDIARTALYDAANYLMELEQWPAAEQAVLAFRKRYAGHALQATLPAKLVLIYQAQGKWRLAAGELSDIANNDSDPEVRRQSLYLAAELFEKSGDTATAILRYRSYAHTYAQPFDQVMEARFKLSELYRQIGEAEKRRFWLKKMVAGDASAGAQRSDRSRYLAAFSSVDLAEVQYQAFAKIPLKLPLKKSLAKKKKALSLTLSAYEKVLDYGVQEFTTQAGYRLGEIYAQLSRDLMQSQRPKGLDALALEQYEILLEEQAFPFEEKAIEIHELNAQRAWQGVYDKWVQESYAALKTLLPGRYNKTESRVEVSDVIY